MIISHNKKFIYVHIPKTAGRAIADFLSNGYEVEEKEVHAKPAEYACFLIKYKRFTSVRHPLDRLVSWFFFIRKISYLQNIDLSLRSLVDIEFEQFVKEQLPTMREHGHFDTILPQTEWFDTEYPYDDIIRYESINEDVQRIAEKLDICNSLRILNQTDFDRKHYMTYYDNEMIDLAYKFYETDFVQLGYSME